MARKIVFTSGKGGTGKTTIVCNVGYRLARRGNRVLICDFDFLMGGVEMLLKIEGKGQFTLSDVMTGSCRAIQAVIPCAAERNLQYLNASRQADTLTVPAARTLLEGYDEWFDYILIDCPSGVGLNFFRALAGADEAVVVSTFSALSLRAADNVARILRECSFEKISLLMNCAKGKEILYGEMLTPTEAASLIKLPLLSVVPSARECRRFPSEERAYKLAAESLDMGEVKLLDVTAPYKGVRGLLSFGGIGA